MTISLQHAVIPTMRSICHRMLQAQCHCTLENDNPVDVLISLSIPCSLHRPPPTHTHPKEKQLSTPAILQPATSGQASILIIGKLVDELAKPPRLAWAPPSWPPRCGTPGWGRRPGRGPTRPTPCPGHRSIGLSQDSPLCPLYKGHAWPYEVP